MLAIFRKSLARPPQELNSPTSHGKPPRPAKQPDEILADFHAAHVATSFAATFRGGAALASAGNDPNRRRVFCALDDIYCIFVGCLNNLSALVRQYGLCGKTTDEALLVLEAYRTLRDRAPYPADQVLKDLLGSFAFVVFDNKTGTVFSALSSDGGVPMHWGIAADGSVVMSDELEVVKGGCGKSFAPFPVGCMFHSERGLRSFEHPMNKLKAMPRVDSEGMMCGASFKVDTFSRINSMPRVGSANNWTSWEDAH